MDPLLPYGLGAPHLCLRATLAQDSGCGLMGAGNHEETLLCSCAMGVGCHRWYAADP